MQNKVSTAHAVYGAGQMTNLKKVQLAFVVTQEIDMYT